MPDFETAKSWRFGQRCFAVFLNMSAELALKDRFEKSAHFFFVASRLQFHAAIGQIPHEAGHIETFRDIPHRPAKANALDIAFVKDLHRCAHASED